MPSYVLRHATTRDAKKVLAFYEQQAHGNLKQRGDDVLLGAMEEKRKLFVIEDDVSNIVAAAAIFEHLDGKYHEAGAARVICNGYSLQKVLLWARTVHSYITDPPGEALFSVVTGLDNDDSRRSLGSLHKSGFQDWMDVPTELLDLKGPGKRWVRFPPPQLSAHAKGLLAADGASRTHAGGSPAIVLDVRIEPLVYYRDAVEKIAGGDLTPLGSRP